MNGCGMRAVRMRREVGYSNIGRVSFLHQPGKEDFAFLDVEASLGADHAVSECISGIDLVKLQIHIARGGRLPEQLAHDCGHAIGAQLGSTMQTRSLDRSNACGLQPVRDCGRIAV